MRMTRPQVSTALEALGLDPHLTHALTISPQHVHVQTVATTDGVPEVRWGALGVMNETIEIEEEGTDVDS